MISVKCFECGCNGKMHNHHVIPKVKGGRMAVFMHKRRSNIDDF